MRFSLTGGERETERCQSGTGKRDGTDGQRKRLSEKRHSILHKMRQTEQIRAGQGSARAAFHVLSWDEGYASRDRGVLWRRNPGGATKGRRVVGATGRMAEPK